MDFVVDDDPDIGEYTSDEGSITSPVDFAVSLPALYRWISTLERCLMHRAERICGLPCKGTTEVPALTEDEKKEIVAEARRGFREGLIDPSDCGPYYQILFSLGLPLNPLDPYLQAEDYNCWAGMAQHSLCDQDASQMYHLSKIGHSNLLAFAQLHGWAEKITVSGLFEVPQILAIDPSPGNPVLDIQFPEWPCSAYSDEEELFTLQTFLEIMLGKNHFRGLYSLFNVPTAIDSYNVKISIDVMRTMFDDLEKKFQKCSIKGVVPRVYRSGEDVSDEHAIHMAVDTALASLAGLASSPNPVLHGHLSVPFLQVLSAGAAADPRIARAVHPDHLATLLARQLDVISDANSDFPAVYCAYVAWITVMNLITVLSRSLIPQQTQLEASSADATAFGCLLRRLYPLLVRSIADSDVDVVGYTSLQTMYQCFAPQQLPDDTVLYLVRKGSLWEAIARCCEGQECLQPPARFGGLPHLMPRDKIADKALEIDRTTQLRQIFKVTAVGILRVLCRRGLSLEGRAVVMNAVGKQLLKRNVVELLLDVASSEQTVHALCLLLECLQCLARAEEGRHLILKYPHFSETVRGFIHHCDANVAGLAILLSARLLKVRSANSCRICVIYELV